MPRADPVTRAVLPKSGRPVALLMVARLGRSIVEACVSVSDRLGLYLTCAIGCCK